MMCSEQLLTKEFFNFVTPPTFEKQFTRLLETFQFLECVNYPGIAKISLDSEFYDYYIAPSQILGPYSDADRWLLEESKKINNFSLIAVMFVGNTHEIPISVPIVLERKGLLSEAGLYTLYSLLYQYDWRMFLRAWHDRNTTEKVWQKMCQDEGLKCLAKKGCSDFKTSSMRFSSGNRKSRFLQEIKETSETKMPLISLCDRMPSSLIQKLEGEIEGQGEDFLPIAS